MEEITIEIPKPLTHAKLSEKRRRRYYKKGKKIPKRYQNKKYRFNRKGILVDSHNNPVIANPRAAGTPHLKKINGQDFYKGEGSYHLRVKIVRELKSFFRKHIRGKTGPTQFPVQIEMELHELLGNAAWDLDNLWIYGKCLQDAMVDEGFLPEDNIMFVTKPAAPELVPVEDAKDRKMVLTVRHDNREIIQNHQRYNEIHSQSAEW